MIPRLLTIAPLAAALAGCLAPTNEHAPDAGADVDASATTDAGAAPLYKIASFSDEVWTWDQTLDACSYSNMGNTFWDWLLVGREPVADGRYPLFIHLHGTGDTANTPTAVHIVESMASHGFVAASVAYDSLSGLGAVIADPTAGCAIGVKKGNCLFGGGQGSAITKLCARPKADCSKGIVLSGHSQGSWLAIFAKDHDPRVRAAYGLGAGVHEHVAVGGLNVDTDLSACIPAGKRALPADRLRVVDGQSEYAYGMALQADVRALTDMSCPDGTMECLRANGSGFTFFPDAANQDGRNVSQHCYMVNSPTGDCNQATGLNTNWTDGTGSYALEPSLAWLRSFTDPPSKP